MNCEDARNRMMLSGSAELTEETALHLKGCSKCATFLGRLELAEESLRGHRSEHQPDAYFAQRVSAVAASESDQLGWAAVRLLPVALALTLVLTAWAWLATPGPSTLVELSPTEDLLGWVLEENGS